MPVFSLVVVLILLIDIQIARKTKGEKISYSYGQSNSPFPEETIFSEAELFEISWFDQMVKFFHEHQSADATDLERYRPFLPEIFIKQYMT